MELVNNIVTPPGFTVIQEGDTLEQAKEEAQKNFNSFVEQKFAIHNKR